MARGTCAFGYNRMHAESLGIQIIPLLGIQIIPLLGIQIIPLLGIQIIPLLGIHIIPFSPTQSQISG